VGIKFIAGLVGRCILLLCLNASTHAIGQTVKVYDQNTLEPIERVFIYSQDQSISEQTDQNGQANLSKFSGQELIIFQHSSYNGLVLSYEDLSDLEYKVGLTERIIKIDEIVISANKWETAKNEIANQITSISAKEIGFNNPQTAADVVASTGQVFVQKSQLGGGSPMIRGFAANSVLIVVDGIRMNNAIFRSGNLQSVVLIDPNILKRTEVLYGPGTVAYGSGALGGVMSFDFVKPELSRDGDLLVEGAAFARFASANLEKTGHFHLNLGGQKFSSLTSLTYSNFDDLITGNNRTEDFPDFGKRPWFVVRQDSKDSVVTNGNVNKQVFSGYNQVNFLQKFKYRIKDQTDLIYSFYYTTSSDIPRYDRLIVEDSFGNPESAEWYYGPQKWMIHALEITDYQAAKLYDGISTKLSYQAIEESRNDRKFNTADLRNRTEEVDVATFNIDFQKEIGIDQALHYGVEVVYNSVRSTALSRNINDGRTSLASTRYPDGGSETGYGALYTGYDAAAGRFNFSAGLRYDYSILNSRFEDTTFYNFPFEEIDLKNGALSGSLGAIWQNQAWRFSGLVSSGFRSPNVDDIGKVFDSEPGNVVVPNPDLGPEYSYNFEASFSRNFADRVEIKGTIFYSLLRDAVVRRNFQVNGQDSIIYDGVPSRVQALVNVGRAYVWGYSLDLAIEFSSSLGLKSTLADTEGRDQAEQIPIRHTTPVFGQTSLVYRKGKFQGRLMFRYSGSRAYEDLPPSEQNKTFLYTSDGSLAWNTINVMASYRINSIIQVNGAIENVLNKHYRPYSSGISAPGRNVVVSLRTSF